MSTVIRVENLSKQYRLGEVSTGTLAHDFNRWWHRLRGKPDPYLKIGEVNDRSIKGSSEYVWALRDINFEVKHGEVLGIIGKNGAGKSTLLKILSRVTKPTTGRIRAKGRVASLLEVGTGFHPELTGRENIFLNGAILGMTKAEIRRKFDEIVDFSGVERYIDTPVKRYSSGMYVRLAFAVAAHLEPEILVVDEVLAVGDAEFQKKCLGKMKDVSEREGRTVLFVSHNMAAVQSLCTQAVLLEHGGLTLQDHTNNVIDYYISSGSNSDSTYIAEEPQKNDFHLIQILDVNHAPRQIFNFEEEIKIKFIFNVESHYIDKSEISFRVIDQRERIVFTSLMPTSELTSDNQKIFITTCTIPHSILVPNTYKILAALYVPNVELLSYKPDIVSFTIEETGTDFYRYVGKDYGCVIIQCSWT